VFLTTHLMEEAERLCDRVAIIDRGKLVDVGTPAELVRRHCPDTTVILRLRDDARHEALQGLPGATSVVRDGVEVTIRGGAADLVTEVIRAVAAHQLDVTGFRTEHPTLEDVFLRITGHAIRD
jgi:ABC-2 type transport system ATP-binding protein